MEHCRASEYRPWEQRVTCVACAHPLAENPLVKDLLSISTTAGWAKRQLAIIADMLLDRNDEWLAIELRRIADGIRVPTPEDCSVPGDTVYAAEFRELLEEPDNVAD